MKNVPNRDLQHAILTRSILKRLIELPAPRLPSASNVCRQESKKCSTRKNSEYTDLFITILSSRIPFRQIKFDPCKMQQGRSGLGNRFYFVDAAYPASFLSKISFVSALAEAQIARQNAILLTKSATLYTRLRTSSSTCPNKYPKKYPRG